MVLLRPKSKADALWAFDQALRCTGVGAVWAAWDRLDGRDFRRLQLAAESGRTLGILVRPSSRRGEPTWAEVQWEVRPEQGAGGGGRGSGNAEQASSLARRRLKISEFRWRLWVELARCRGLAGGQTVLLELGEATAIWREAADHATHTLPASARVARSASARGA
jgi:protein ImuA